MNYLKQRISKNFAHNTYTVIALIALCYHLLIMSGIIDYKNAWGGNLHSLEQMYGFEIFSIILQIIFFVIISLKTKSKKNTLTYNMTKILCYVISFLFVLNTLGNVLAIEPFEKLIFTPLTLISAILVLRIGSE